LVRSLAAFAPRDTGFLRSEFVRGSALMRDLAAFAAGKTSFLGSELVRRAFFMRGLPSAAGNDALLGGVHGGESSTTFGAVRHGSSSLR
jgi:hypothetical protein